MEQRVFWKWFADNQRSLKTCDGSRAADRIEQMLTKVDSRLAVEVSDEAHEREVTILAGGDSHAFALVRKLIRSAPSLKGWQFRALKPPRGFDFAIDINDKHLDANELSFEPLRSSKKPKQLGIRFFVPSDIANDREATEMLWIVLETGIGEELASKVFHLETTADTLKPSDALPITDLRKYVSWFFTSRIKHQS